MDATFIESYVAAAARAQCLELSPAQLDRVCAVFARNAEIAQLVLDCELPETVEPAPVFTP
jgi:hypothetical protein